jgi:hypothetical protein
MVIAIFINEEYTQQLRGIARIISSKRAGRTDGLKRRTPEGRI